MKYETGDVICLRKKNNPLSYAIRKIAKVKYNHVGVIIKIYHLVFVAESIGKGFVLTPLEEFKSKGEIAIYRPVYKDFYSNVFKLEVMGLIGRTPYDFVGLVYQQLLWNTLGVWVGKQAHKGKDRMYCYESMAYLHRRSKTFDKWWRVKPSDLYSSEDFALVK